MPDDARTMVIVPTILDSVERVEELLAHLEVQALGNLDPHIHFALLSDFRDAATETLPRDAAILAAARAGIEALNAQARRRTAPTASSCSIASANGTSAKALWMGWERKRGKIEEFNRLLRGATDTSFVVTVGDPAILPQVRYCITLDSDTRLPRDAARQLIGIITHPLNRAVVRSRRRPRHRRLRHPPAARQRHLHERGRLAVRAALLRPHRRRSVHDRGVRHLPGSVRRRHLHRQGPLRRRRVHAPRSTDSVPENALLSHDLFEGLHARVALVSDVELVDDYPSSVLAHARRQHRWIRGDWQILFWLFPFVPSRHGLKRNTLPLIGRWKILDNLRRSLVAPALLALLVAGWTVLPGPPLVLDGDRAGRARVAAAAARWRGCSSGPARSQSFPVFLAQSARATRRRRWRRSRSASRSSRSTRARPLHAIALTLVRLVVTRRRLLEWETAAAHRGARGRARRRQRRCSGSSPNDGQPDHRRRRRAADHRVATGRRCASARAVPAAVDRSRRPSPTGSACRSGRAQRPLGDDERALLRRTARKTWRYFETFVTADDGWLPPDNYQESGGEPRLARRTSPTNIGMGLLSTLAAHDLGYLTTDRAARRARPRR